MSYAGKRIKNICPYCNKLLNKHYTDCPICGGGEYYKCPKCRTIFDIETGEEL